MIPGLITVKNISISAEGIVYALVNVICPDVDAGDNIGGEMGVGDVS